MSQNSEKGSTSKKLIRGITRELVIPIVLALIVIQFVIQAFRIPTGSMENHLLVGDFLLGIKFVYGIDLPFSDARIAISEPDQGDVVIFRYPGDPIVPDYDNDRYSFIADLLMFGKYYYDHKAPEGSPSLIHSPESPKDFIKRCIAVGGQTIQIIDKRVFVDGKEFALPKKGKFRETDNYPLRDNFGPYTLPKAGDHFKLDTLSLKELYNIKSVIAQENPSSTVELQLSLAQHDQALDNYTFENFIFPSGISNFHSLYIAHIREKDMVWKSSSSFSNKENINISFNFFKEYARTGFILRPMQNSIGTFTRTVSYTYFEPQLLNSLEANVTSINTNDSAAHLALNYHLTVDGTPISGYTTQENTFFMMGDNRHNSDDSRFWGVVSNRNIKAKAFITYFSFDDPPESSEEFNRYDDFQIVNPFTWFKIPAKIRWSRIGKLIHPVK